MIKGKNKKKTKKDNKHYWYHYDNRENMNNDYPYNQYDNEKDMKKMPIGELANDPLK